MYVMNILFINQYMQLYLVLSKDNYLIKLRETLQLLILITSVPIFRDASCPFKSHFHILKQLNSGVVPPLYILQLDLNKCLTLDPQLRLLVILQAHKTAGKSPLKREFTQGMFFLMLILFSLLSSPFNVDMIAGSPAATLNYEAILIFKTTW